MKQIERLKTAASDKVDDLVTEAAKHTLRIAKQKTGYEFIADDYDDVFILSDVLQALDPVLYERNAIQTISGQFQLLGNNSFTIFLKGIRTFVYVKTYCKSDNASSYAEADIIYLFISGVCAKQLGEIIQARVNRYNDSDDVNNNQIVYRKLSLVDNTVDNESRIKKVKSVDQIFTNPEPLKHALDYIGKWITASTFFASKGLTHKLGILLYGPPGTGKTTLAQAIANEFDMDLVHTDLKDFGSQIADNLYRYSTSPFIFLIEDIDLIFSTREGMSEETQKKANILLQLLDGVTSVKNMIVIATTNEVDKLDPALVRDGRFDIKIHVDNIEREHAEMMVKELNICNVPFDLDKEAFPINPAELQNKLIKHNFANLESIGESVTNDKETSDSEGSDKEVSENEETEEWTDE